MSNDADEGIVEELLSLETSRDVTAFVDGNRDRLGGRVVRAIAHRAERALSTDPRRALRVANVAIQVSSALGDRELEAVGMRSKAHVLSVLGQHEEALRLYEEVSRFFADSGGDLEMARTNLGQIEVLRIVGQNEKAIRLFEQTAPIFVAHKAIVDLARLNRIAASIHFWQNRFNEALRLLDTAEEQFRIHGRELELAQTRMNKSVVLPCLNRFREATKLNEMARTYFADAGMRRELANAELAAGNIFHYIGQYGHAIDRYREARRNYEALGMDRAAATADTCLANTYLKLGLFRETIDSYRYAQDFFQRSGMKYQRALVDLDKGVAHGHLGELSTANDLLDRAEAVFAEMKLDDHLGAVELERAKLSVATGDHPRALQHARRATTILASSQFSLERVEAELIAGWAHLESGRLKAAAHHFATALQEVDLPWVRHHAHHGLGRIDRARGHREKARQNYQKSIEAVEQMHRSLRGSERLSLSFMRDKLATYQEMVSLCLEMGHNEEAFEYVERAKSRTLADLLASKLDLKRSTEKGGMEEEIQRLREELNWYYSSLEGRKGESDQRSEGNTTLSEIDRLEKRLSGLLRSMRDGDSGQRELASLLQVYGISPDEMRGLLDEETMVVEYYLLGEEVMAFSQTSAEFAIHRGLALRKEVEKLLAKVRFHLDKFIWSKQLHAQQRWLEFGMRVHLQDLYDGLLRPISDHEHYRRLVVIPHGMLHFVPFHALHDGRQFVIERHDLSYCPSAGVFCSCRMRDTGPGGKLLAMAVPDEHIPRVVEEVEAIGALFPQSVIRAGQRATEAELREHAPQCDIVHIATHGVFREDNPLFSRMRLADGWLTANDVYDLKLHASLVTLSACDTGLNTLIGGDELLGMSRGFLYAGAASLLVSLWAVSDGSTKQLMEVFYDHLRQGGSKANALRNAQLSLLRGDEGWSHPYYWAPFILIGGGE